MLNGESDHLVRLSRCGSGAVLGSIGVSGGSPDQDETIAPTGLASVVLK